MFCKEILIGIKNINQVNLVNKEKDTMIKFDLYKSKTFGRICYVFGRDEKGYVYIKDDEDEVVRMIYSMTINGHSLQNIQA